MYSIGDMLKMLIHVDEAYTVNKGLALIKKGSRIYHVIYSNLYEVLTPYYFRLFVVAPISLMDHKKKYGELSRYLIYLCQYLPVLT